jgi:hypothetical protein
MGSAVLTPNFFAISFFARIMPWRFSLLPPTATGKFLSVSFDSRVTDAKKLFKSQCKITLSIVHPPFLLIISKIHIIVKKDTKARRFKSAVPILSKSLVSPKNFIINFSVY